LSFVEMEEAPSLPANGLLRSPSFFTQRCPISLWMGSRSFSPTLLLWMRNKALCLRSRISFSRRIRSVELSSSFLPSSVFPLRFPLLFSYYTYTLEFSLLKLRLHPFALSQLPEPAIDSLSLGLKASLRQPNAILTQAALSVLPRYLLLLGESTNISVSIYALV